MDNCYTVTLENEKWSTSVDNCYTVTLESESACSLIAYYSKKCLLANCVLFQNPNKKDAPPFRIMASGETFQLFQNVRFLRRKRYFLKKTLRIGPLIIQ